MRSLLLSTLAFSCLALAPHAAAQAKCDDLFAASREMAGTTTTAYEAINAKDQAKQKAILPALEAALRPLPAAEIKPEVCNGNHINAYSVHQFAELSVLRARGLETGFPANLPLVKQPELNQLSVAYAAGWIKYELGDFNGALEIFAKGLAMFPHNASLQNEYIATLMQLKRYKDTIAYTGKVIETSFELNDTDRAKVYFARGLAQLNDGDNASAKDSVSASINYNTTDDAQNVLKQLQAN